MSFAKYKLIFDCKVLLDSVEKIMLLISWLWNQLCLMWEGAICCPRSAIITTSDPASFTTVAQANFFLGEHDFIFLVVILLSYTKFIFTAHFYRWAAIHWQKVHLELQYILQQSRRWPSSGQLSVAAAGRGMKTCLCFLRQSPSPEHRSRGDGCGAMTAAGDTLIPQPDSSWVKINSEMMEWLHEEKEDQSHRAVSLLQNTGWPQKRQISRFAHCRDRACLFSKVSRTFHSAGWRLLSHNVPCLHCCVEKFNFSSHQISRQFAVSHENKV